MTSGGWFLKKKLPNDFPYYRQVWAKMVAALLAAALIPLMVIGGGISTYTFEKIQDRTLEALKLQVKAHQQAIDHFLAERENQLKIIAATQSMADLEKPGRLQALFQMLQQQTPGFIDLGVIDLQGRHRAYTGPFTDLLQQTYDQQAWFLALTDRNTYISDVYLGHRRMPHFIIAVKHGQTPEAFILRATVDSDVFDALVAGGPGALQADTFIINRQGLFQTRPRTNGSLLSDSGIRPDPQLKGVDLVMRDDVLVLSLWQDMVPWLNVVRIHRDDIFAGVQRARLAVMLTFVIGGLIIAATVLLTTGNLVRLLESKGQSIRMLDTQLRRASFMASSMEVAMGYFEDIKDLLANIEVSVQWMNKHPAAIAENERRDTLTQIADEVSRGHHHCSRLIGFMRHPDPLITDVPINGLLDDLLALLDSQLKRRHIEIIRDYPLESAAVRSDQGKLRQVFLQLMLNAIAAVDQDGWIRLTVRPTPQGVEINIRDSGPGIDVTQHDKIFEPLFTTHSHKPGLGLSICKAIIDELGGRLLLENQLDHGATFTVTLPCCWDLGH